MLRRKKKPKKNLLSWSPTAAKTCDRIRNSLCCCAYLSTLVDKNQDGVQVYICNILLSHLSPSIQSFNLESDKEKQQNTVGNAVLSSAYIKPDESGKMAPTQQPHPAEHNAPLKRCSRRSFCIHISPTLTIEKNRQHQIA